MLAPWHHGFVSHEGFCIMAGNKLVWYLRVALLWRNLWQWSFHVRFWFAAPVSSSFFTLSDPSSAANQNSWSTGASQIPGLSWCMARSVLYDAGPWYIFCSKLACLKLSWHLLSHLLTYPITGTYRNLTPENSEQQQTVLTCKRPFSSKWICFPLYGVLSMVPSVRNCFTVWAISCLQYFDIGHMARWSSLIGNLTVKLCPRWDFLTTWADMITHRHFRKWEKKENVNKHNYFNTGQERH